MIHRLKKLAALLTCAALLSGCGLPLLSDNDKDSKADPAPIVTDNDQPVNNDKQAADITDSAADQQPASNDDNSQMQSSIPMAGSLDRLPESNTTTITLGGSSFNGRGVYTYIPNSGTMFMSGYTQGSDGAFAAFTPPSNYSASNKTYGANSFNTGYSTFVVAIVSGDKSESYNLFFSPERFENLSVTFNDVQEGSYIDMTIVCDIVSDVFGQTVRFESTGRLNYFTYEQLGYREYPCSICAKNVGVCTICDGTGFSAGSIGNNKVYCPSCNGSRLCKYCNGTGKVYEYAG